MSHARIVIWIDSIAILYYAVTSGIITTVAHICARILGMCLWMTALRREEVAIGVIQKEYTLLRFFAFFN